MDVLELAVGLGVVQGLLLLLLIGLRFRRRENLSLALLLLVFSVRLGTIPTWTVETMLAYPWLLPLVTPLPFLFGPLLWWYAHTIADDSGLPPPGHPLLHALPYLVDLVFTTALVVLPGFSGVLDHGTYPDMIQSIFAGSPPLHLVVRNGLKVVVNVVYVTLAIRLAFGKSPASIATPAQRLWLRLFVVTPVVSLAFFGYVAVHPMPTAALARGAETPFTVLAVAMALLIYVCSFLMLMAPEIPAHCGCSYTKERAGHPLHAVRPQRTQPAKPALSTRRATPGYQKNKTPQDHVSEEDREIAARIMELLNAHLFLDPDLSITSVSQKLRVHPNRVSRAINCVFGESFPSLLQRHRIHYFIARARSGCLTHQSILDLAFESGFSSKSTFNRVFRAETGMSPTQLRDAANGTLVNNNHTATALPERRDT